MNCYYAIPVRIREDDYVRISELAETMDVDESDVLHDLIKFYFDCRNAVVDGFNRRASMEFVED